nr:Uncharacterised protein [Neisseria gonorrhoeae]
MVAFIKQFFLRFVLHHKTDKQCGTERGQHKQDVAADVVEGIENIFAEHGNVFPRAIAQNRRDVAENEDDGQYNRDCGGTADFGFFLNGRNQHFINRQRSCQRGNQEQREENDGEHRSCPHM